MAGSGHSVSVETKVSIMSLSTGKTSQNVAWMLSGAAMMAVCVIMFLAAIWISGVSFTWSHGQVWLVDSGRTVEVGTTVLINGDIGRVIYTGAGTIRVISPDCYVANGSLVSTSLSSACNTRPERPITTTQGDSVVNISGQLEVLPMSHLEVVTPI